MEMTPSLWHLWLIAALVLGALEMKLSGFVTLWFALGAAVTALVAALGLGVNVQLLVFIAVSVALFAASRTVFREVFMRSTPEHLVGPRAMLGQEAIVVDAISSSGDGTVRINGELWSARSLGDEMKVGERVRVEQVEGLKLWVRRPVASNELPIRKES